MHLGFRVKQILLLVGDLLSFILAFWASIAIRYLRIPNAEDLYQKFGVFLFIFLFWIVINYINGLYDLEKIEKNWNFYKRYLEAAIFSLILGVIFFYLFQDTSLTPKTILALNVVIGYFLSIFWRLLFLLILKIKGFSTKVIFVGYSAELQELKEILNKNKNKGFKIVALIDHLDKVKPQDYPEFDVYHGLKTLRPAITNHGAKLVVVAPDIRKDEQALREIYELLFWSVDIVDLTTFYEILTGRIPPVTFSEGWFIDHLKNTQKPVYDKLRNLFDYLMGIILGTVCLILFPLIALVIRLESKGKVIYKQKRIGQYGKVFDLIKFRSMYSLAKDGSAETNGAAFAQKNDCRVTRVGKILRKLRLDELPQAWNLLKRDITLIGPRPERPEFVQKLQEKMPYYTLRHVLKPGLTGWAVIHQNYTDTFETTLQKLQYDLFYIKNRSFLLDVSIVLKTINIVIRMMGQ